MATGVAPKRHGITGFKIKVDDEGHLVNSSDRQVKAFWNILSDHDLRVATIGWWATWPVEPVNGLMVAQVNSRLRTDDERPVGMLKGSLFEGLEGQVHPPQRQAELLARAAATSDQLDALTLEIFGSAWDSSLGPVPDRLWQSSRWAIRADAIYADIGRHVLEGDPGYDLLAIYFGGPDVMGHRFWRYREPGAYQLAPDPAQVRALEGYITDYYVYMDSVLGSLLQAAPPDTTVLVLSDHGMEATNTKRRFRASDRNMALVSGGHAKGVPAFFAAAGPNIGTMQSLPEQRGQLHRMGSVYDLLPTLCALLELPVADDLPGEVMEHIVDPAFLEAHPVRSVPTHTPSDWLAQRPSAELPAELEQERTQQLRELGYLE